jgi:hypothetical protein
MKSRTRDSLRLGATTLLAGLCLGAASGRPAMNSRPMRHDAPPVANAATRSPEATEALFRGDMSADIAVGCGGPGPTEWATKVTATLLPTFGVVSTTYSVASPSGPTWDLVAWNNGASPGSEIQRCPLGAANGTPGSHTVTVPPGCLTIPQAAGQTFFFGLSQGTDVNTMSAPQDTSGSTPGTVFIRAPGCGLPNFGTVESIGFPGFWVHRIIVDDTVPVELMSFGVE